MGIGAWARRLNASRRDDRGAVAIIVALFLLIFMVLLAFVVDFGRQYSDKAQLQNAVDAAALAGAARACTGVTEAQTEAVSYASKNGLTSPVVNVANISGGKTVTVSGSRQLPTVFGQFVGVRNLNVAATASASVSCGIIFSVFAENNLTFNGTATSGYTLYFGNGFTYNGGGQPSTFDGVFHPGGGALPANVTPSTATDVDALTAAQFYSLLQAANSSTLPTIASIDTQYCFDTKIGSTNYTGKYGTEAQFKTRLNQTGTLNCKISVGGDYDLPSAMKASLLTDASLKLGDVDPATPPTVTSPLLYSSGGSIKIDKVHAPQTVFYAGSTTAGTVTVSEGANANQKTTVCTVIAAANATWSGGRQQAGCVNPVLVPGANAIGVALTN